jgi:hypothetical protein
MTYGWAILVVLAAIGALAYFGVLNPSNFLPNKCVASPGISCIDKPQVTDTYIAQAFTANTGYDVTYATATSVGTSVVAPVFCLKVASINLVTCANVATLVDGTTYIAVIRDTFIAGQSVKEDITLTAVNPNSGLTDSWVISLSGKI